MRLKKLLACLLGGVLVLASLGLAPAQALAATRGKIVPGKLVYDAVYGVYGGYTLGAKVVGTESDGNSTWSKYQYSVIDSKGNVTLTLSDPDSIDTPSFGLGNGFFTVSRINEKGQYSSYLYRVDGSLVVKAEGAGSIGTDKSGKYALVQERTDGGKQVSIKLIQTSDTKVLDSASIEVPNGWIAFFSTVLTSKGLYGVLETADPDRPSYAPNGQSSFVTYYYFVENGKLKKVDDIPNTPDDSGLDQDQVGVLNGKRLYYHGDSGVYDARDEKGKQVTIRDYKLQLTKNSYNPSSVQRGSEDMYYAVDSKGKYGAIDSKGNVLIPFEYDDIYDSGAKDTNLILVKKGDGWYYYDTSYKESDKPSDKITFSDVKAGDEVNHASDVQWLAESGISEGWKLPNGTREFRGMQSIARADMAAFLYRLAGSPSYTPSAKAKTAFKDVSDSTPHAKEIRWLYDSGISKGFSDGSFRPYATIARQDTAAFLRRLADKLGKKGNGSEKVAFSDVKVGDDENHASDVEWLAKNGISKGWKVGNKYEFRGLQSIARQDMAAFLHKLDANVLKK